MIRRIKSDQHNNTLSQYLIAFFIGLLVGFIINKGEILGPVFLSVAAACAYYALQNNVTKVMSLLPYLVYAEIFIRSRIHYLPYLFVQDFLIVVFLILLTRGGTKFYLHSRAFIFMVLFALLEFFDAYRATDAIYARGLITNTMDVAVISIWASSYYLVPIQINKFLNNVKIASIFLCGIVLVKHYIGGISYGLTSSTEALNGLAPVQISGYLGFSAFVFFLAVMSEAEKKQILVNIVLLGVTSVVMLFSFSRGGIYFLGIMMGLYFFFNRAKAKSYLILLLLIPVGFSLFLYVKDVTGGLIVERYKQEGSSGRDLLVESGLKLFNSNPLAGVGTGNYNSQIIEQKLYSVESGAHNEFIRAAAEHGSLGILTYWIFFIVLFIEIITRRALQREYGLYFFLFFCLITIHNGLKISIQPLLILMAIATPSLKITRKKRMHVPIEEKLIAGS